MVPVDLLSFERATVVGTAAGAAVVGLVGLVGAVVDVVVDVVLVVDVEVLVEPFEEPSFGVVPDPVPLRRLSSWVASLRASTIWRA